MTRFTPLRVTLLSVFCIYWFIFFPIIWFVVRPSLFVSDIWQALFFAIFLLIVYCILHLLVLWAFDLCELRRRKNAAASNVTSQPQPDTVIYEKRRDLVPTAAATAETGGGKPGVLQPEDPELRFVSSFKLFYDGRKFRDSTAASKY